MNLHLSAQHGCLSQSRHQNLNAIPNLHVAAPSRLFFPRQPFATPLISDAPDTVSRYNSQPRRFPVARATLTSELPPPEPNNSGDQKEERNPLFTGPQPTIILAGFYLEELPAIRQLLDAAGGHNITLVPCMPWLLDLPLHRALAEGEPQWEQPMPQTWVQGGGWGRKRVALFNDIASLAQGTILTMFESSPVGQVCGLATTAEDMEINLGDMLAKAVSADAVKEDKQPKMEFVESMEALPPIETLLGDTVEQLKRDKAGIFEENTPEKEEKVNNQRDDGDGDGDEIDLIDKIVAEFSSSQAD